MFFSFYRIDSLGIPWLLVPSCVSHDRRERGPSLLPERCLLLSPSLRAELRVTGEEVPVPLLRHLLSLFLYTVRGLPSSDYEVEAAGGVLTVFPPVRLGTRYVVRLGGYDSVASAPLLYAGIPLACRTVRWQGDGRRVSVLLCREPECVALPALLGTLHRASLSGDTWLAAAAREDGAAVRALCGGVGLPVDLVALGAVVALLPTEGVHTHDGVRLHYPGGCVEGMVDATGAVTLLLPAGDILRGHVAWEPVCHDG